MDILPNIPRNYTAIAEWLACLILLLQLPKVERKKAFLPIVVAMGIGQIALQNFVDTWPLFFWIAGMIVNVLWMLLTLHITTKLSWLSSFYNVCKAFIFAEFIAALSWQLYCYLLVFNLSKSILFQFLFVLFMYIISSLIYYYFNKKNNKNNQTKYRIRDIVTAFLTAVIIFTMSNIGFIISNSNFTLIDSFYIFLFRSLVNLCGIFLLYIQENQRYETYLRNELSAINNVFQSQYEQYQAYQESHAIIDRKFHDLKHQIYLIEMETNSEKKQEYFSSLREDIKKYEFSIKTGNPVIDTILTRKNIYCIQNHITLTCIADGSLLDFLNVMDICSLLGNALDNAIESTLKIADPEKRLINLRITKKAEFVLFSIENYTEISPEFENGLPKTTKTNKDKHGYGLKSISYLAEKYEGNMTINYQNNWFKLNVLLPKPTKKA